LLRASDLGEVSLAAAVEELFRVRLLRAAGDGFYFSHDRIREVVYESMFLPHRRMLHGAVARALERANAHRLADVAGTIGYHFARAGEPPRASHT